MTEQRLLSQTVLHNCFCQPDRPTLL